MVNKGRRGGCVVTAPWSDQCTYYATLWSTIGDKTAAKDGTKVSDFLDRIKVPAHTSQRPVLIKTT